MTLCIHGSIPTMQNIVTCPRCGNEIGTIVTQDDVTLLKIGGGVTRSFHGYCAVCGSEFHWEFSDMILQSLMKRILTNRSL